MHDSLGEALDRGGRFLDHYRGTQPGTPRSPDPRHPIMEHFLHGTVIAQNPPEAPVHRDHLVYYGGVVVVTLLAALMIVWLRRARPAPRPPEETNEPPRPEEKR